VTAADFRRGLVDGRKMGLRSPREYMKSLGFTFDKDGCYSSPPGEGDAYVAGFNAGRCPDPTYLLDHLRAAKAAAWLDPELIGLFEATDAACKRQRRPRGVRFLPRGKPFAPGNKAATKAKQ
jgi:hypothetical protein